MNVSVILPTYNRLGRLRQVLAALGRQTYAAEHFEVVVVSDGSSDGTDEYLSGAEFPFRLVFASQRNSGPAATRNRAVGLADGDLLVFIDDDVVAAPSLIEQHVRSHLTGGDSLVVIGPMLTPLDCTLSRWVGWEQAMLYKQYDALVRGRYEPTYHNFYTGNASVARTALVAVNGFDVRYRRAEDIEMAYRLACRGFRFRFNAAAASYHYAERTFDSWLGNAYDYGVNAVIMARDHDNWDEMERRTRADFCGRNVQLRALVHACLRRPWLGPLVRTSLRTVAQSPVANGIGGLSRIALSGVYNLSYYQGMVAELGDARALLQIFDG